MYVYDTGKNEMTEPQVLSWQKLMINISYIPICLFSATAINEHIESVLNDYVYDTSVSNIKEILKKLEITKSRGPDELPPILFRNVDELSLSLSKLFYKINQTSIFPDKWKIGGVSPLCKKLYSIEVR